MQKKPSVKCTDEPLVLDKDLIYFGILNIYNKVLEYAYMANTIVISTSAYKELLTRLSRLEKMMVMILGKFESEPPYGSDKWWDWAHEKGLKAKEKGEYTRLKSREDIDKFFDAL